jgi:hypothetical protein
MEQRSMNQFEHDHNWIETARTESKEGVTIQRKCDGCGLIMSIGPGKIEYEADTFKRRVIDVVVADIKANGPIRMALLGL